MSEEKKMTETWLPVVGYEDLYEVSDQGRVRSLDREVPGRNSYGPCVRKLRGRAMKPKVSTSGHLQVGLWRDGQVSWRYVHRLVLEAFRGSCPPGHEACHYDDDPTNNQLSNLRWDTHTDNMRDMLRNGNHRNARKTHCPQGHEFDDENTYVQPDGSRSCRECRRAHNCTYRARRRAA